MLAVDKKSWFAQKWIGNHRGRIYFSRAAERRFYFAATVFMMVVGILCKVGWL